MTRVIIVGAAGRMGRRLVANVMENPEFQLAGATEFVESPFLGEDAGLVAGCGEAGVKITANLDELVKHADAIIDFATGGVMEAVRLAVENNCAAVIGTTALSAAEKGELAELAERGGRIVSAYNMSVGVNLLFKLVGEAARTLGPDYDVEIIEMHHNQKKDAPSGTAVRLAEEVCAARGWNYATDTVARAWSAPGRSMRSACIRCAAATSSATTPSSSPSTENELSSRTKHPAGTPSQKGRSGRRNFSPMRIPASTTCRMSWASNKFQEQSK